MTRFFPKSLLLPGATFFALPAAVLHSTEVDFARDIQPILTRNCTECHGGVKAAGDVSFVYEEKVINFVGDSGNPVVKPGNVKASELFYRITTTDEDDRMPPVDDHAPLEPGEIALIKKWIEEGAKWSGHWAFVPPRIPALPESKFDAQAKGAVDRFLFARLETEGLSPSTAEEPGRLLRRLSLGLTGLPPTLAELESFEKHYAENPDAAVERTVDVLMARPAFGERWASMWLDLVRYADSGGLGMDQRRTIWAYRDWVIQALNDDMPFNEFTIRQLAGDLLPSPTTGDLIATACHRNTQTNNEGGTDDEEFRVEAVIDRVNTTWQTWGSITFSCTQCHDHPYDPFRHTEYYEFMDFFNNTADSDLDRDQPLLKVPSDPAKFDEADKLRKRIADAKIEKWKAGITLKNDTQWKAATDLSVGSQNNTKYTVEKKPEHAEFFTVGTVETGTRTQISAPASNFGGKPVTAIQITAMPHNPETSVHSPEWGFVISTLEAWIVGGDGKKTTVKFRSSVPDVPWMPTDPTRRIGNTGAGWGADSRIHHARQLVLVPESPLTIPDGTRLDVYIHCKKTGHGSHPMAIQRGWFAGTDDPRWTKFETNKLDAEISEAETALSKMPGTTVPYMQERPEFVARPTHIFARGNPMDKEDKVTSGLPASLTKVAPGESANRLDMARWWVSDSHPLTARVFVNRLWEQLFGTGIVPTLEDFGSSGDKPTHPELLDYLAVRFQKDHKWSVKAIVREMVVSHAYRQSAKITPELLERDPANRLIARGPRLRLTAEFVRDQSLALSGLLSGKTGGAPVHPPLPSGIWRPFEGGDKWNTPKTGDENRYRRSIYTYLKRSIPYPTFAIFDSPSREFCTPRRLTSNTPLQALTTLNDAAFVECAETLGKRMAEEFSGSAEEKIARALRLVTARTAKPERVKHLVDLHGETGGNWTVIAQVLLNLDEALTY